MISRRSRIVLLYLRCCRCFKSFNAAAKRKNLLYLYIYASKRVYNYLIERFLFSTTEIRYDSTILKTIISIVPEIICLKILFLQTFVFCTLQEHFVFIEKKQKQFNKVYRTVQELGIQAFTEQSSRKFTELFRIKCRTFNDFS